jgi:hypothetical protein
MVSFRYRRHALHLPKWHHLMLETDAKEKEQFLQGVPQWQMEP